MSLHSDQDSSESGDGVEDSLNGEKIGSIDLKPDTLTTSIVLSRPYTNDNDHQKKADYSEDNENNKEVSNDKYGNSDHDNKNHDKESFLGSKQMFLDSLVHDEKITIRFKAVGSTPSVNPKIFKISSSSSVSVLIKFLCNRLKSKTIYVYISNSFQPNPDENLGQLYQMFGVNNELIINYCNSIAFG
ncbi:Ubiquitin-like protein [Yamadazyma tenuis]|nr:Ubiquitin-like protein [Yamadazyma tenuis]